MTSTSGVITAESRESLFWVSGNGVRFRVANDGRRCGHDLDQVRCRAGAVAVLRTFAAGPALSRDAALLARDTVPTTPQPGGHWRAAKAGA